MQALALPPRGSGSQELAAQEEREQNALVVLYSSPAQIPDTPAEPSSQIPEDQVDEGAVTMTTGADVDAVFWSDGEPALVDAVRPSASVAELVGQLQANRPDVVMGDATQAAAAIPNVFSSLGGINADQLQELLQRTQSLTQSSVFGGGGGATLPSSNTGGDAGWAGNTYPEFDRGYQENGTGRGAGPGAGAADPNRRWGENGWNPGPSGGGGGGPDRGGPLFGRGGRGLGGRGGGRGHGRGRGDGRSTRRKACSFFQAGRRAHPNPRGPPE